MTPSTFSLEVEETSGSCPSGERWAKDNQGAVPVLSCEGPCIRGDIARLAANHVARKAPYARACYAESVLVPHSTMASWVRTAEKVLVIDGCFLHCMRRLLSGVIPPERLIHMDALTFHKKYSKVFHMDGVPGAEREETARLTAEQILAVLSGSVTRHCGGSGSCCG